MNRILQEGILAARLSSPPYNGLRFSKRVYELECYETQAQISDGICLVITTVGGQPAQPLCFRRPHHCYRTPCVPRADAPHRAFV